MHLVELEAGKNLLQQNVYISYYIHMQRCGYEDKLVKQNDVK